MADAKAITGDLTMFVVRNFNDTWVNDPPTPEWSMGNYDDVFNDGVAYGRHLAAEEVKRILESNND